MSSEQTTDVVPAKIVLGQIGTNEEPEPSACRSCGKSARACGRSPFCFCCTDCAGIPGRAGTSFLTHYPPVSTVADRLRADLGEPVMDAARERDNTPAATKEADRG